MIPINEMKIHRKISTKEKDEDKVPIYKGCSVPSGTGCFCTGECRKIIGYRDKHPLEKTNFGFTINSFK